MSKATKYQKKINTIEDRYHSNMQSIADKIFTNEVVPFCDKYDLSFRGSWGSYTFYRNTAERFVPETNEEKSDFAEFSPLLDHEIGEEKCLGSLMGSYNITGKLKRRFQNG